MSQFGPCHQIPAGPFPLSAVRAQHAGWLRGETVDGTQPLRAELESEREIAASAQEGDGRPTFPEKALRAKALVARRQRLHEMRREGTIGDAAFHRVEEELDLADLAVATRLSAEL